MIGELYVYRWFNSLLCLGLLTLGRQLLLSLDARLCLRLLLTNHLAQWQEPAKKEQKNHNKQNVFATHIV